VLIGSYTYSDADGDLEGTSTFRWLRDGFAISNAYSSTYTVGVYDLGKTIKFQVTPRSITGPSPGVSVESAGLFIPEPNSAPVASSVVTAGNLAVGQMLTGSYAYSDADGDIEDISTFKWLRNDVAITGATSTTRTLTIDDLGKTIKFEVTPVAQSGVITGTSVKSTGVVILNSAPIASSVSVTGSSYVGNILAGAYIYSDVDGDTEGISAFRWLRDDVSIVGANSLSYTTTADDLGKTIKFEVTPISISGTTTGIPVIGTFSQVIRRASSGGGGGGGGSYRPPVAPVVPIIPVVPPVVVPKVTPTIPSIAPVSLVNATRTLKFKDKGNDVLSLQNYLYAKKYLTDKNGIDGKFGKKTELAVKAFQKKNNLKPDGKVGKLTREKMK
jgi:hypothetical protein